MNDLISEFFIDIITRIIPGFIILALYPDKLFNSVFAEFQNTPILLIPGLIGAAWVIGFAIEQASYLIGAWPIRLFCRKKTSCFLSLIGNHTPSDCFKTNNKDLEKDFKFFKFNRRHQQKQAGERIFFRVMCAISIFTGFHPPTLKLLSGDNWPPLSICHYIPLYSFLGALIFGAAWFWIVFSPSPPDSNK